MSNALPPALTRLLARLAPPEPITLAQWRDELTAEYRGRARPTRLRMAQGFREVAELAGPGATTLDLTPGLLDRYAAAFPGRMPATTNGLLRAVRAGCNAAVARGWLAASPFPGWPGWKDEDVEARRHHGRADVARVLAHLREGSASWDGGRLHALAAVLSYCGLRLREALCLRVEEIDLDGGFLRVERTHGRRLKTSRSRGKVPMPAALVTILTGWLPRCGSDWVFPGERGRGPWTGGTTGRRATDRLKAAGRAVGVEGFTPQSLRRSLATHLVSHSGRPRIVQQVLRHARQTTEDIYIKRDLANLRAAVLDFDFAETAPPRLRSDRAHVLPRKRLGRRPACRPQPAARIE